MLKLLRKHGILVRIILASSLFLLPLSQTTSSAFAAENDNDTNATVTDATYGTNPRSVTEQVYLSKDALTNSKKKVTRVKELTQKRTRTTKTFLNSDQTETMMSSSNSLHYKKGDKWDDIDTTIQSESQDANFTNKVDANNFVAKFNKKSGQGIKFQFDQYSVVYNALNTSNTNGTAQQNIMTYTDAWTDTDLQYSVENDGVKMLMLLKTSSAPKQFKFKLKAKDVIPQLNSDGSIDFLDSSSNSVFQVPQMWVRDSSSNDLRFDRMRVELKQDSAADTYILQITLNDEGLQYPITIDPTTSISSFGRKDKYSPYDNKLYIDTINLDVSRITNVRFENSGSNARAVDVYLTKGEYGNLNNFGNNAPAPGSDGRSVAWVGKTIANGTSASVDIPGDTIRSYFGSRGNVYGGAVWDTSYIENASISITYYQGPTYSSSANFSPVQGMNNWYYQEWNGSSYVNMVWDPSNNYWKGSYPYTLIGASKQHPDMNDSVRKWIAPASGSIRILGNIRKADTSYGDGVNARMLKNTTQLWAQSVPYNDGVGYSTDVLTDVVAGDAIYFILNTNGTNYGDSTEWNPIITYTNYDRSLPNTLTYSPSASFGSRDFSSIQGLNNWYYQEWNGSSYVNMTWDGSNNQWKGSNPYSLIQGNVQHPDGNDSARKWVATAAGTIRIIGNVKKGDTSYGDGVIARIMKNTSQMWSQGIPYNDGVGYNIDMITNVVPGDALYFVINQNGNNYSDWTVWDPSITYVSIDTIPPSAPTNLTYTTKTNTSVSLAWFASTDNMAVSSYDIYLNNNYYTNVNATSVIVDGLTQNTSYNFTVKAKDAAGNISTASDVLTVTTNGLPLQSWLDYPSPGITMSNIYRVQGWVLDANGVSKVEIWMDGSYFAQAVYGDSREDVYNTYSQYNNHSGGFHLDLNSKIFSNGNHTMTVKEISSLGIVTTLATRTFSVSNVVDAQAPTVASNVAVSSTTSSTVTLTWTASTDNVGVTGYDIYKGATLVGSVNGSTTTYTVTGLTVNTSYSFTVKAKDAAGNVSVASNSISMLLNGKLTYTYDTRGRLKSISITSTGEIVKSFDYDNNGNLKTVTKGTP